MDELEVGMIDQVTTALDDLALAPPLDVRPKRRSGDPPRRRSGRESNASEGEAGYDAAAASATTGVTPLMGPSITPTTPKVVGAGMVPSLMDVPATWSPHGSSHSRRTSADELVLSALRGRKGTNTSTDTAGSKEDVSTGPLACPLARWHRSLTPELVGE